jgi:hypothetical protein
MICRVQAPSTSVLHALDPALWPAFAMYADEEYSDESINLNRVCSWSINDVRNDRTVVNILIPGGYHFNSDTQKSSTHPLPRLIERMRELESVATDSEGMEQKPAELRAARAFVRDYDDEALRFIGSKVQRSMVKD